MIYSLATHATLGCKADRARTDGALGVRHVSRPPRGGGSGAVRFAFGKSDGGDSGLVVAYACWQHHIRDAGDYSAHVR